MIMPLKPLMPLLALAIAGCAASSGLVRTELRATLTGHQQTPGPGDLDATGTALFRLDGAGGRICWELHVRGTGPATGAAVHRAPAGATGPAVLALATPDASGRSEGCAALAQELAQGMARAAHDYYVVVSSTDHPQGAVRGQLSGGITDYRLQRQPVRR